MTNATNQTKEVFEYIPEVKTTKDVFTPWTQPPPSSKLDSFNIDPIETKKSYECFAGKSYTVNTGLIGTYLKTVKRREYELLSGNKAILENFESPISRVSRLQTEVSELLEVVKNENNNSEILFETDPAVIRSELDIMEKQLNMISNIQNNKSNETSMYNTLIYTLNKQINNETKDDKKNEKKNEKKDDKKNEEDESLTYELYCSSSNKSDLLDITRVIELESRISDMEYRIGLNNNLGYPDMQSGIMDIAERLIGLDKHKLDSISRRIQALMTELDQVVKKRDELDLEGKGDSKILSLYEICHEWRGASQSLPNILKRLKSLKALHQQAGCFASRLTVLETQQNDLLKMIEGANIALSNMQKIVKENAHIMKNNADLIQEQINKIKN
eukprot:GHVL01026902.1.p1 GENE.GHVL01026902.1~~GHVL01026902.1.p1  ORF type:complete len:388 (-),score=103.48 GHVL01026902.1:1447-2610(-)